MRTLTRASSVIWSMCVQLKSTAATANSGMTIPIGRCYGDLQQLRIISIALFNPPHSLTVDQQCLYSSATGTVIQYDRLRRIGRQSKGTTNQAAANATLLFILFPQLIEDSQDRVIALKVRLK